jgi:hypothetical protein
MGKTSSIWSLCLPNSCSFQSLLHPTHKKTKKISNFFLLFEEGICLKLRFRAVVNCRFRRHDKQKSTFLLTAQKVSIPDQSRFAICFLVQHTKTGKYTKMATKYTKWPSLKDTPTFTQIGIFGLKIYHLATMDQSFSCVLFISKQCFGRIG